MKTPIQEILGLLKSLRVVIDKDAEEDLLNNEKEFAKQCFEAGIRLENKNFPEDIVVDYINSRHADFEEFYKQFEQ